MSNTPIDNGVQLGCGTLIIIAIIVMVFSGGSDSKKLRGQIEDLIRKVDRIEQKVDELSQKLNLQPPSEAARPAGR